MPNKLQELTDRLYNEGLSKGKSEGEEIVKKAVEKAQRIVAQAEKEAANIMASAQREAENMRKKTGDEVRAAAVRCIAETKERIENMIVVQAVGDNPEEALSGKEFIKEMIENIIRAFNAASEEPADLDFVLSEQTKEDVGPFLQRAIGEQFGKGVRISCSGKFKSGFTVAPRGKGYFISFTDEEFKNLISEYLRPATRKIVFG